MSEPEFGRRNSALETVANDFTPSNMIIRTTKKARDLKTFFHRQQHRQAQSCQKLEFQNGFYTALLE
jgi:hypothetical protein